MSRASGPWRECSMIPCWGPALLTEDLPALDTCLEPRVWGGLVASRAHLPAGGQGWTVFEVGSDLGWAAVTVPHPEPGRPPGASDFLRVDVAVPEGLWDSVPAPSIPSPPQRRDSLKAQSEDDPLKASVSPSGKWGQLAPSSKAMKTQESGSSGVGRRQLLATAPPDLLQHFLSPSSHP